ncbi:ATP SYNTHASE EPSILON CHAIN MITOCHONDRIAL [Salix viminalis]|uniref:ATP synthase subunit epsilon, mitochondrial n=1 Tax=Salix viminalis TaxID=40686 RepID=A0A9Q0TYA3_SALVM|nr:ATP SYNTHASE EPSILON CHAIN MITOCHONDRIAL [Salix viminalis]
MASNAAAPFWRAAGMTYITYSNICANLVRNCLKEPFKTEALSREKVHFSVTKFVDGNPQKPASCFRGFVQCSLFYLSNVELGCGSDIKVLIK